MLQDLASLKYVALPIVSRDSNVHTYVALTIQLALPIAYKDSIDYHRAKAQS